eukprot:1136160-Pelagomonas_calceolata.AAC.2
MASFRGWSVLNAYDMSMGLTQPAISSAADTKEGSSALWQVSRKAGIAREPGTPAVHFQFPPPLQANSSSGVIALLNAFDPPDPSRPTSHQLKKGDHRRVYFCCPMPACSQRVHCGGNAHLLLRAPACGHPHPPQAPSAVRRHPFQTTPAYDLPDG